MRRRPADTLAKVEGYFGAKVMPGSQEACMPFWLEYVQKVLVDFGENLLVRCPSASALQ